MIEEIDEFFTKQYGFSMFPATFKVLSKYYMNVVNVVILNIQTWNYESPSSKLVKNLRNLFS